jgi:hypothetical protein
MELELWLLRFGLRLGRRSGRSERSGGVVRDVDDGGFELKRQNLWQLRLRLMERSRLGGRGRIARTRVFRSRRSVHRAAVDGERRPSWGVDVGVGR